MPKNGLEGFLKNPSIQRLKELLTGLGPRSHPLWWVIPGESPGEEGYWAACRRCPFARESKANRLLCQRSFLQAIEEARQRKGPLQFLCPVQQYSLCLPIVQNGQIQGYLGICHSEEALSQETMKLAGLTLETAARETERSQQLKNLSEAIQPRCVALSTIHTIHRLISSTLNLKELLPRVARLCCQVLRSQSCAIWLTEGDGKTLIPRAVIEMDSRKKGSSPFRPCRMGVGLPGKVASRCQAHTAKRIMAVPLVEEEPLGVIVVQRKRSKEPFSTLDQEILTTLAEQAVVAIRNAKMYEAQERITWGTIKSLSAILDGMESYSTGGSSRRQIMADVALAIAQEMGVPVSQHRPIQYAALLHDAGRVGIPEEILRKPTKLEPAEFARVKEHPIQGARLLQPLEILEPALPIILYHHERYDGTGYPKGLRKEAIPLGARILAVANAFEAMVCERPYRQPVTVAEATREIASHAGTQFDPKIVRAFLNLVRSKKFDGLVHARGS